MSPAVSTLGWWQTWSIQCTMQAMKTVGAEVLQEQCASLLDGLDEEGVLIMRGGKPIAKLVPVTEEPSAALIGSLRGKIRIMGDLLSTGEQWDAES